MAARTARLILIVCALLACVFASAQTPDPAKWSGSIEPANPRPGARAELVLKATIEKGWHLYSQTNIPDGPFPTEIKSEKGEVVAEVGKPTQADPHKELDKNFGKEVEFYADSAEFRIPIRISKTAKGASTASATVKYQTCDDRQCMPPLEKKIEVKFTVDGAPVDDKTPLDQPVAPTAGTSEPPVPTSGLEKAKSEGLFSYLLFAVVAGFGALLTPCVFPMIPITVSFFSKKKEGENSVKKATAYCIGIVGTFTALGVIVSAVFGAAGLTTFANNPILNLVLAVVFILLAFSLFGFFEIGIPSSILSRIDGGSKTGLLGPILMGLTFSLTSFTCTLPFVGTVLVSASQGDY
ncbi:MAG: hypothetical protein EOP83_31150, partial [Verrucomicrobiaceae bacterium]